MSSGYNYKFFSIFVGIENREISTKPHNPNSSPSHFWVISHQLKNAGLGSWLVVLNLVGVVSSRRLKIAKKSLLGIVFPAYMIRHKAKPTFPVHSYCVSE